MLGRSGEKIILLSSLVLTDRDRPLQPLMLFCTLSVSLNLSRRRFIVNLVGVFPPGQALRNCRWVWTTDFVAR